MRNPISLDFVDQISVDVTPFDVSRGNNTGGSIAVVTKSGTNEFKGTYYTLIVMKAISVITTVLILQHLVKRLHP